MCSGCIALAQELLGAEGATREGLQGLTCTWMFFWLQGSAVPVLVCHGRGCGGRYTLVTSRVFGRRLTARDSRWLPHALQVLQAVHDAGILHGAAVLTCA